MITTRGGLRCSNPVCGMPLGYGETTCPLCGAPADFSCAPEEAALRIVTTYSDYEEDE